VLLAGSDHSNVVSSVCHGTKDQNARSSIEVVWKGFMDAGMRKNVLVEGDVSLIFNEVWRFPREARLDVAFSVHFYCYQEKSRAWNL